MNPGGLTRPPLLSRGHSRVGETKEDQQNPLGIKKASVFIENIPGKSLAG
jgi:hypothetical protein